MRRPGRRGSAITEYAALVAVLATLIGALLVMRPHRVGRVPIDPVKAVGALVHPAPVVRPPRLTPPRVRTTRPRRPARPRPRRPVVRIPEWLAIR